MSNRESKSEQIIYIGEHNIKIMLNGGLGVSISLQHGAFNLFFFLYQYQ